MSVNTQERVKNYSTEKKEIMPFSVAYSHLMVKDAKVLRNVVCDLTGMSQTHFRMKKNGFRGITEQEKKIIEQVFVCFGIEAFTGEPIKKANRYESNLSR